MLGRPGCDFSFSGLKTAVRQAQAGLTPGDGQAIHDLAASFQLEVVSWPEAVVDGVDDEARRFGDDIPIMLSPTTAVPLPAPMQRVGAASDGSGRRSLRLSSWLSTKRHKPAAPRKARHGFSGCEGHLKKAFGGLMTWI